MGTEGSNLDQVLISVRQIVRAIDLHSKKLIQEYGLTIPQILVLKAVENIETPSVGKIADAINLSQGTVTQIIIRLEQRGLVIRSRDEVDKRKVLVRSTDNGTKVLESAPPLLHDKFITSFTNLMDWEQNMIISSLQRVAEMMGAGDLDAAPVLTPGEIQELPLK